MKCNKLIICGFTKIYLYRFYIPGLIRLANDVQTTQVQELGTLSKDDDDGYENVA